MAPRVTHSRSINLKDRSRFLWDPDTPREFSTVRFAAEVNPSDEEIVWLVDGTPVAKVGYPHELR